MAQKGREFEKLVAHLETILSGTGIEIRWNDKIRDIHTGKKRQIDVSLKTTVGTHEILIIMECRERKNYQDVRWIEELDNKRDSIKAAKVVAVCSKGFTQGAIDKAKYLNVELRSIDNLLIEDIQSWCRVTQAIVHKRCHKVIHVELVRQVNDDSIPIQPTKIQGETQIFSDSNPHTLNINDLSQKLVNQHPYLFNEINAGDPPKTIVVNVELDEPLDLILGTVRKKIFQLHLYMQLWIEESYVDASRIIQYSTEDGKSITQAITFEVDADGKKIQILASNVPEKGTKFSVQVEPD